MKKLITAAFVISTILTTNAFAFTLAGTPTTFPEAAVKQCATADNYFVCLDNYQQFNQK